MKEKQKRELMGQGWGENIQLHRANVVTAKESKWTNQFALTSYQDEYWRENNFDFNMADFLDYVFEHFYQLSPGMFFTLNYKGIMALPVFQIFNSKQTSSHHTRNSNPNECIPS